MVFVLACIGGCRRDEDQSRYVARVGDAVLTESELALEDSIAGGHLGRAEIVNNWVTSQLLYQEAVRKGVDNRQAFRRSMTEIQRKLAIAALLDEEIYGDTLATVTDEEVTAAYQEHAEEYVLKEDVVRVSYALFRERDAANAFRSDLLGGLTWEGALGKIRLDTLLAPSLQQAVNGQFFTRATLFPEELWRLARSIALDQPSFVVRTDFGYYVLKVHSRRRQGEVPDIEYVHDEISDRLLIERRRTQYERLLSSLRDSYPVDVRIDTSDTTHKQYSE